MKLHQAILESTRASKISYEETNEKELREHFERDLIFLRSFWDGVEEQSTNERPDLAPYILRARGDISNKQIDRFERAYKKHLAQIKKSR